MVRLLTVIGHGTDLIEHHIKHYENYVDEIQYIVYETDLYPTLSKDVSEIIKEHNKVKIIKTFKERIFDWEKVTQLYNFVKSKKPNDWWVIADIDEFHLYPDDSLRALIYDCDRNGWDLVRGGFIDRIGENGDFPKLKSDENIFSQFNVMCFFRYPLSNACPNKVCVVKGYVEITSGQHYAKIDGQTTWKWQGWGHPLIAPINTHSVQVHHFKWDETAIERIKSVADIKQEYAYSKEYRLLYDELKKTKFKIDMTKSDFMCEFGDGYPEYKKYSKWNNLIKKITSI
jgi:hypothetical protein